MPIRYFKMSSRYPKLSSVTTNYCKVPQHFFQAPKTVFQVPYILQVPPCVVTPESIPDTTKLLQVLGSRYQQNDSPNEMEDDLNV